MGGNSKQQIDTAAAGTITPVAPAYLANTHPTTMPEAMPGQLGGLARDMAAGGYGSKPSMLAFLQSLYSPVPTLATGAPVQPKKPVTPVTKPGGGTTVQPPMGGSGTFMVVNGKFVPVAGGAGGANSR